MEFNSFLKFYNVQLKVLVVLKLSLLFLVMLPVPILAEVHTFKVRVTNADFVYRESSNKVNSLPIHSLLGSEITTWLTPMKGSAVQQRIQGIVTDKANQEPMVGVSVSVKGKNAATSTTKDGTYTITASIGDTLLFRSVGYVASEIAVTNNNNLNIELSNDQINIEEVEIVSVGYGRQLNRNVTGSVVRANLKAFEDAPNTNLMQNLQGAMPGLNIGPVTKAGSTPSIQVRGRNSISGNQNVLIILDGIQYNNDLSSINPDDIESIDLLKDASATAVYGSQASNGVLLITSKRGLKNEKPVISFSTNYATQSPSNDNRPMNREEFLEYIKKLYWNKIYEGPDYTTLKPNFNIAQYVHRSHANESRTALLDTDYNWWKEGIQTGFVNDNQLSINGASEKISYLLSGGYTNQQGFIKNDKFRRISARSNIEIKPYDWLTVGLQGFGSFVNQDGAEPSIGGLFQMPPINTPFNNDGTYSINPIKDAIDLNPFLSYDVQDYDRKNYFTANTYLEVKIPFIEGLRYRMNFGNNYTTMKNNFFSKYAQNLAGEGFKKDSQYYDYTFDNILTYERNINHHSFTATALYGAVERKSDNSNLRGVNFPNKLLGYDNLSLATLQFTTSDAYREALNYQMLRVNYAYKNKYLLTGTWRRDGFSAFGQNNKFANFPSVSVGWVFSDEALLEKSNFLNFGKIRAGYGVSGNQTPRYTSQSLIEILPGYVFGDGGSTSFAQSLKKLENENLSWEKTRELNIGLDLTILKNRLSATFEYYDRITDNLLFNRVMPQITGFSDVQSNIGKVGNKGFEIMLNSKNIQRNHFNWNTTFVFSRNINKVLELLGTGDIISSNLFIGQPLGAIYGYRVNGIYQLHEEVPKGFYAGSYRIVDTNDDKVYNANDRVILGSDNPAYRFSILNSFDYKGIGLSFFVNSIQGGENGYLGNNTAFVQTNEVATRNNRNADIDFWSPNNPNGEYPVYAQGMPIINPNVYKDRSFVRLQDITLSYDFGKMKSFKNLNIKSFRFFISGKNLLTVTNWKGWDPEIQENSLGNGGRPLLKSYSIGITTTF